MKSQESSLKIQPYKLLELLKIVHNIELWNEGQKIGLSIMHIITVTQAE